MKQTLSILVKNDPGVLIGVIDIFNAKKLNIDSLAVGITDNVKTSRITIVADLPDADEIISKLSEHPFVLKARCLTEGSFISRSHVFIKVKSDNKLRGQIVQIANIFRAKVVDVSSDTTTLEITGDEDKINALSGMLEDFGILEIVRAGSVAIERGTLQL
ncbi:MAG: acetolactate synthase small subunit [Bacillota bacterium]|nr:acetolactate synthase small subunit [Bacillota bacterium]